MRSNLRPASALALFAFFAVLGFGFVGAYADGPAAQDRTSVKTQKAAAAHDAAASPSTHEKSGDLITTPDKSVLVHLNKDAASVVVTNPAHAVVQLESPRLLVVMPREPGTTQMTVLDRAGKIILQQNIIVTAARAKYVRVRRVCNQQDQGCVSSAYAYCPDGCYEVSPVAGDGSTPEAPPPVGYTPNITPQNGQQPLQGQTVPHEGPMDPSKINVDDDDVGPGEEYIE